MTRRSVLSLVPAAAAAQDTYSYTADSERQTTGPRGKVTQHTWSDSKVYPGTVRDYWIYVPAQYDAAKPACLMVLQDGQGYQDEKGALRLPVVFDNLIHKREMPVTIALMVSPGVVPAANPNAEGRYNRSFEYDATTDRYAQFLITELIPEVAKSYNLSNDPNDRAIGGQSSGAIAALTAAWHRPDQFRRVVSFIGSYVNLRGGNQFSSLVRKCEPRPLRIWMQDGSRDNNLYAGDWWMANQDLYSALDYAGYEVTFVKGTEGHNMRHGGPLFPEAVKWVWRGHGTPIAKPKGKPGADRFFVSEIADLSKDWEQVSSGHKFTEGPAVAKDGSVYFTDVPGDKIHHIALDGKVSVFVDGSGRANGMMFGADGRLYACQNGKKRIVSYGLDGSEKVLAENVTSNDLAVLANGRVYFTDPPNKKVMLIDERGNLRTVAEGIEFPNGVIASTDQTLLMVADFRGRMVWSYQIAADGSLVHGQAFGRLETIDETSQTSADGMTVDSEGYLYVATRLGLQVLDQPGRTVAVLSKPHSGSLSNVVFAGPKLDWLYVTAGDRVFRRPAKRTGVWPWQPVKPPKPRL
ncbi:MAG: SMP-30/gluconolactonase/LRE family protein [Bryobacteraceae bacterium]|nr:SMP-30/gluconolactonase/LRE family protein [Bryobacteraceae bacterium]